MRKIYEVMDIADAAYILHSGKLTFEISPDDRYYLEGKEIIFGAEEPLIAYKTEREEYFRFQTVYVDDDSKVDKIPPENLQQVLCYGFRRNVVDTYGPVIFTKPVAPVTRQFVL